MGITKSNNNQNKIKNKINRNIKPLSELNLIDEFLISTLMENLEDAKKFAKLTIKRALGREIDNFTVESQKVLKGIQREKRGICMDILISGQDADGNVKEVFDIEPNTYREDSIEKRTRYYNSLADVKLLSSGQDFDELPELIAIWILPFDPFNDNRMLYTVKNFVVENNNILYNDGVTTIFLNAKGQIGGNKKLKEFLNFMVNTREETAVDDDLQQMKQIVDSIKGDPKVGERYMSMETTMYYEKKLSYAEGKAEGKALEKERSIKKCIERLRKLNVGDSDIEQALAEDYGLSTEEIVAYLKGN